MFCPKAPTRPTWEGWLGWCPFGGQLLLDLQMKAPGHATDLNQPSRPAEGPQLLRRHQSLPPGPDPVAGGAGEPGGRQVWADSPFIPRLGQAQTTGRPCSPCGACPYRA